MILAELEVRHSRAVAPTRRVALGDLYLPAEPRPGYGPLLLAAVLGAHAGGLDDELREDLDRLIWDLELGRRISQPRLRHRFQTDVVGLDRSHHRLVRTGRAVVLELDDHGGRLPQVLGALYAATTLDGDFRPAAFRLLRRATRWEGEADGRLMRYLAGEGTALRPLPTSGDERWALRVLGFPVETEPLRGDILRRFRRLVRDAHPDHGGLPAEAGAKIQELADAKRILLTGA
ncbi:MAG: hypothetical protein M3378_12575 [Actinomycetota bacterium]|nr:hypothetical protein [Actinomycetota bacterium]MDQ3681350.1 hypothetical protein [Actinomycetota bacterium]